MTKLTFTLRAIILSALCVPVVFSCSNYLDFQEDIGNGKDDDGKTYQVSVLASNAEEGESVIADAPRTAEGATITLTASLNAGRRVALSADGVVITPSTISADGDTATFTMPSSAVIVTATFSDIPPTLYAITVTPSGAEAGELVTASVSEAAEGTTITLTASLGVGRRVALSADGVVITPSTISANGDTASFTMSGNAVAVVATFSDIPPTLYAVTVTPSGAASGESVTASVTQAKEGTNVTLTAALGAGRRVALSADGVVITPATISTDDGTATFTMPGNAVAVTATFYSVYPITITPNGAASGESVTASVSEAAEGTTITLTAALGASRRVALSADGVVITPAMISADDGTATFTMPGNAVEVTATFSDILYPITITPTGATGSEGVTASVSTAAQGTTITLTAALGASRRVVLSAAGVTITPSTIITSGDTATFTMPGNAVTVSAAFTSISAGYAQSHTVNGETFNTHYVPSGRTFIMGEHVQTTTQTVTLTKNFWMGETEVTQGLWEAVMVSWPGTAPSSTYGDGPNKPAYYVNWYDAVAFCNLLTEEDSSIANTERVYYSNSGLTTAYTTTNAANSDPVYVSFSKKGYRLPTEAEWEYAARYIDGTNWNGGDHVSGGPVYTDEADPDKVGDYAWYSGNNLGSVGDPAYGSKDVGQKTANSLGLKDMSGNVWEWCYDWYDAYSGGSEIDPTGPASGTYRVRRGGYWSNSAYSLRCAHRYSLDSIPTTRRNYFGFRLCRTAD